MRWIPERNIILIGMPGCEKHMVGKALADKIGYLFIEDLSEDELMFISKQRNVIVPNDVIKMDFHYALSLRRIALVVYVEVAFELLEPQQKMSLAVGRENKTETALRELYLARRHAYEHYAHISLICQQKEFDIGKGVEVVIKMYNELQEKK